MPPGFSREDGDRRHLPSGHRDCSPGVWRPMSWGQPCPELVTKSGLMATPNGWEQHLPGFLGSSPPSPWDQRPGSRAASSCPEASLSGGKVTKSEFLFSLWSLCCFLWHRRESSRTKAAPQVSQRKAR